MRPDAEIFAEARRMLDARGTVPAGVRVHVDHGVVTLTGTVRLPFEQLEAEDAVRHVRGVHRVVNEIVVADMPNVQGYEPPGV
jgi:osmotically-inducible protein OsmY